MNDWESRSHARRVQLVTTAQSQIGAHYLMGATGGIPDICAPLVWYFQSRVEMYPNTFTRQRPVLYAARTRLSRDFFCAGRSDIYTQSLSAPKPRVHPVPNNAEELNRAGNPNNFLWPRTSESMGGPIVFGESCLNKRHFDCVHFVNWCVSCVLGRPVQKSIDQWFEESRHVLPGAPDPMIARLGQGAAQVWVGDIEISRANGHIGLLTGDIVTPQQHMVHAQSTGFGVRQTPFSTQSAAYNRREASVRRLLIFLNEDLGQH